MKTLDPDLLRTFLAFVEGGSLARAAATVGRSASAVTAQIQRLEADLGVAVLAPIGRGRALSEAGEALVPHARRILDAHRDARLSIGGLGVAGRIGLGLTQDFADTELPDLLRAFARSHPRVRIDLRVGRTVGLADDLAGERIDVAVILRAAAMPGSEIGVLDEPMEWLIAQEGLAAPDPRDGLDEIPLALLDPPCGFREATLAVLADAGRPHRIAATSPSLAGLRASVRAGLAITVRTARFARDGIIPAPRHLELPDLPLASFCVRVRREAPAAATRLAELLCEGLGAGRADEAR